MVNGVIRNTTATEEPSVNKYDPNNNFYFFNHLYFAFVKKKARFDLRYKAMGIIKLNIGIYYYYYYRLQI
jgi:hypothetical protein